MYIILCSLLLSLLISTPTLASPPSSKSLSECEKLVVQGRNVDGIACFQQLLEKENLNAQQSARSNLGIGFGMVQLEDRVEQGCSLINESLKTLRNCTVLWKCKIACDLRLGQSRDATTIMNATGKKSKCEHSNLDAYDFGCSVNLGNGLAIIGRFKDSYQVFRYALQLKPDSMPALQGFAVSAGGSGLHAEAKQVLEKILIIEPDNSYVMHNLGVALLKLDQTQEASVYLEKATVFEPQVPVYWKALGEARRLNGQYEESIKALRLAHELDPNDIDILAELGTTLKEKRDFIAATEVFEKAYRLQPNDLRNLHNLADMWVDKMDRVSEGMKLAKKAAKLCEKRQRNLEDYEEVCPRIVLDAAYKQVFVCDWSSWNETINVLETTVLPEHVNSVATALHPFQALSSPISLKRVSQVTSYHSQFLEAKNLPTKSATFQMSSSSSLLRIGYLAVEFGTGSADDDLRNIISHHNSSIVQVECLSIAGRSLKDQEQSIRACGGKKHFHKLDEYSHHDAAIFIRNLNLHLLIDHTGWLSGNRMPILMQRPAPIQISLKGYPGPLNSAGIDYQISDRIVTPPEYSMFHREKMVYLPCSYFLPSHNKKLLKKQDEGLIFGNFNQHYKFDPRTFAIWAKAIAQDKKAKFWIISHKSNTTSHMQRIWKSNNASLDQLVITNRLADDEHVKIKSKIRAFWDTPMYNGHGTAADSLWVDVPVITLPLEKFSTRVAASFNRCIKGTSRMFIARNWDDYEWMLSKSVVNPSMFRHSNSSTSNFFNTVQWMQVYETSLRCTWEISLHYSNNRVFHIVLNK